MCRAIPCALASELQYYFAFCHWFLDVTSAAIVAKDITELFVPNDWEGVFTPVEYCTKLKKELFDLLRLDAHTSPSDVCLYPIFF
jgi:hypothetical protein